MKDTEKPLEVRREEQKRETWIKNVLRIYPNKTRDEVEVLYTKILIVEYSEQKENEISQLKKQLEEKEQRNNLFNMALDDAIALNEESKLEVKEKPDFEDMIKSLGWDCDGTSESNDMLKLCNELWTSFVIPRDAKIAELEKELSEAKESLLKIITTQSAIDILKDKR